jgi:hypothetical protein
VHNTTSNKKAMYRQITGLSAACIFGRLNWPTLKRNNSYHSRLQLQAKMSIMISIIGSVAGTSKMCRDLMLLICWMLNYRHVYWSNESNNKLKERSNDNLLELQFTYLLNLPIHFDSLAFSIMFLYQARWRSLYLFDVLWLNRKVMQ